jgi:hypothetical protein
MSTEKTPKKRHIFNCEMCVFISNKKSEWNRHITTQKHFVNKNGVFVNNVNGKNAVNDGFVCGKCNKKYKCRSGLWRHNKICNDNKIYDKEIINANDSEIKLITNLVMEIVKNNNETQKQMIEMCKNNNNNNNNNNTNNIITNSNNKTFNLQIFLNEQCKNAMNLSDFIASIKLQMSDLESLGTLGYTEGMHTIIFKEFIDIELFNRPFHCSDLKREIIYIKDGDKWEKEDPENKKLKNAIRSIEKKNFKLLNEWAEQHPKINDCNSPDGDKYLKLLNHATSGDNDHMNKVIKKLVKNIIIDKNMV